MKTVRARAWKTPVAVVTAAILAVGGLFVQLPFTAANAADELGAHTPNNLITLSDLRLTRAKDEDFKETTGPLVYEGQARFSLSWSAVEAANQGKLKVGDSFSVTLPQVFNVHQLAPFDLEGKGADALARCYPKTVSVSGVLTSSITCKFTDALQRRLDAGDHNFQGKLHAGMKVVRESGVDVTFNLNGTDTVVKLPENKPIVRPIGTFKPWPFYKGGDGVHQSPREKEMRWYYMFTPDKLAESFGGQIPDTITFTDTLTGDHVFHNENYELYIVQTAANPDMQPKDWFTIATNNPKRRDGSGPIDSVNYGTFDVSVNISADRKTATYTIRKTAGEWDVNARYKFLYRTRIIGEKVPGSAFYNKVQVAESGKNPIPELTKTQNVRYTLSAGGTITLDPAFGTFRIIKKNLTPEPQLPEGTKVSINVAWEYPEGRTAADYPGWTPPANPTKMDVVINQANVYTGQEEGKPFPLGTKITLTEDLNSTVPALGGGMTWMKPKFMIAGTETPDTVSFVVAKDPLNVEVANTLAIPSVSVGDFVWWDKNKDGKQDNDEPGIPNVVLSLTDDAGNPVSDIFGVRVANTATNADGKYSFKNLPILTGGKKYKVTLVDSTVPADFAPTLEKAPSVDAALNSNTGFVVSEASLDADKAEDLTLDFGFIKKTVAVGDYVWLDSNRDGKQDDTEKGIKGVVLGLTYADGSAVTDVLGNPVADVTTGDNGEYKFENLPVLTGDKKYKVTVKTAPAGLVPTKALADGVPSDKNSNTDSADSEKDLTTHGAEDLTLDFGFMSPSVSVGDFVWLDSNRDGKQDDTEKGIADVVLGLTYEDGSEVNDIFGNKVMDQTTGSKGEYLFKDLPLLTGDKKYKVTVKTAPAGLVPTKALADGVPADKNSNTGSVVSDNPLNTNDEHDPTLDFGFMSPSVSVGDFVWLDSNRDGLQDAAEKGIKGVVLGLTYADGSAVTDVLGNPVADVTTGDNGEYKFENLPVLTGDKKYKVTVKTAPAGLVPTKVVADPKNKNSSKDFALSELPLTTHGANDPTLDFGFMSPSVSVGDFVWLDSNRDGKQDDTEKGIKGVVLGLTYADGSAVTDVLGNPVADVTTGDNGEYKFENLPVLTGDKKYKVTVKTAPAGLVPTKALADGVPSDKNSNTDSADSEKDLTTHGAEDLTLDFGFMSPSVSVGDFVWHDLNRDGKQDAGEPGLPGAVLGLTYADGSAVTDVLGNPVADVTTGDNGEYKFENLPVLTGDKKYKVTVKTAPAGLVPTKALADGVPSDKNSNTDSADSEKDLTTHGAEDLTLDFGFMSPSVSVGDYVWHDLNRDGKQDAGEPGLPGAVLGLTYADGSAVTDVLGNPVADVTTGDNGEYTFNNLPVLTGDKKYKVTVKTAPEGFIPTVALADGVSAEENSNTDSAETEKELTEHEAKDPTLDFGFVKPFVSVGDFVWHDLNKDGKQDNDEPGLKDVLVGLTYADGTEVVDIDGNVVMPVLTGEKGEYLFSKLPVLKDDQKYKVSIVKAPEGFVSTLPLAEGVADDLNSNTDFVISEKKLDVHGASDMTLDFGFFKPSVSVGDFVWLDNNRNGKQDAAEPGAKGVELKITGPDGKPVVDIDGNVVKNVFTDASGKYSFTKLPVLKAGEKYTVTVVKAPEGYEPTIAKASGTNGANDSSTGSASSGDLLKEGDEDLTLDFGFAKIPAKVVPAGKVARTGAAVASILGAVTLLAAGGALMVGVRRRRP